MCTLQISTRSQVIRFSQITYKYLNIQICIYIWGIYVEEAIEQRTNNNNNRHTHTHTPPFEKALISMHDLKCVQERGINYKLYK